MKTAPALLLLLGLAACDSPEPPHDALDAQSSPPAPGPNRVTTAPAAPTAVLPAPAELVGEWRVAGIDGQALTGDIGIALSIDAQSLSYEPRCAGFVWDYTYARGSVSLERAAPVNPPVDGIPAPVCAVAVAPELRALGIALDHAVSAGRTPENGVLLSGGGHSVTLFSQ